MKSQIQIHSIDTNFSLLENLKAFYYRKDTCLGTESQTEISSRDATPYFEIKLAAHETLVPGF